MATHAPITGARNRAPDKFVPFPANPITPDSFGIGTPMLGCVMTMNDPLSYLEQAYALAVTLEDAASPETAMSEELVQSAARGVATLIHLASIAVRRIEAMDTGAAS